MSQSQRDEGLSEPLSSISEIIQTLAEFAEEFMSEHLIPRDVFSFDAVVADDDETFVISMYLNYPNAISQGPRRLSSYKLHSLPVETLLSIYEKDGLNEYLAENIEPKMPVLSSVHTFTLPTGDIYRPQDWPTRAAVLSSHMPLRPPPRLLSSYADGLDPRMFSAKMLKDRTGKPEDTFLTLQTDLRADDHLDAILLMQNEIYRQEAKKHVGSYEQDLSIHSPP